MTGDQEVSDCEYISPFPTVRCRTGPLLEYIRCVQCYDMSETGDALSLVMVAETAMAGGARAVVWT